MRAGRWLLRETRIVGGPSSPLFTLSCCVRRGEGGGCKVGGGEGEGERGRGGGGEGEGKGSLISLLLLYLRRSELFLCGCSLCAAGAYHRGMSSLCTRDAWDGRVAAMCTMSPSERGVPSYWAVCTLPLTQ